MDEQKSPRQSRINLSINLDQNIIPEKIQWSADDAQPGDHESNALLLALWDPKAKNGMSINLWTKEMTVPEMNFFLYQTFLTLSDTLLEATKNKELCDDIRSFAKDFMEKVKKLGKCRPVKSEDLFFQVSIYRSTKYAMNFSEPLKLKGEKGIT
jgi:gliding motility-associated protein GldC